MWLLSMEYFYYLRFACFLNYLQRALSEMLDLHYLLHQLTWGLLRYLLCSRSLVEEIVLYYLQYEVDSALVVPQAMVTLH
jgi:hypothetical protein